MRRLRLAVWHLAEIAGALAFIAVIAWTSRSERALEATWLPY